MPSMVQKTYVLLQYGYSVVWINEEEFEKRTGIRVSMTRASSGETLTKIRAEKSNPKGDVWWGGTGDPHLQAAEEVFPPTTARNWVSAWSG